MKMMKFKIKYVVLIVLLALLFPFCISALSPIAVSAAGLEDSSDSWVKGIVFLILSFIINHFVARNEKKDPEPEGRIGNTPLIGSNSSDYEILGFYVNWITKYADSQKAVKENWNTLDLVVPFWYTLNSDGSIEKRYNGHQYELSSFAENRNIDMLPLINNSQQNNMILTDPDTRKKAVNNVVDLIEKYNYRGINIDFEFIPEWTRHGYTSFIKLLSKKMPKDKLLTISIFPKIDVPVSLQGAYDYSALADIVDRIIIMTYDNHWSTGPAGPVAPINWVEENIKYALEYIPSKKIILGIANYGYDWKKSGKAEDISAKEAVIIAKNRGAEIKWHNTYQTPYYYYWDNQGEKHEVWFENSHSTSFKLNLVKKYNLKGIGIWKLGNSSHKFWDTIESSLK